MAKNNVFPTRDDDNLSITERACDMFSNLGLVEGRIEKTQDGGVLIQGVDSFNQTLTYQTQNFSGYQAQNVSVFSGSPEERKEVAQNLYNAGKTQAQIAGELGVSQKTISNDLKK